MIWFALAFKYFEWITTLIMFRLFIYLNIVRAGDIQLYTLFVLEMETGQENITTLMNLNSFTPAIKDLRNLGWAAPWMVKPFSLFFRASQMSTETYIGRELHEINWVWFYRFGFGPQKWLMHDVFDLIEKVACTETRRGFWSQ